MSSIRITIHNSHQPSQFIPWEFDKSRTTVHHLLEKGKEVGVSNACNVFQDNGAELQNIQSLRNGDCVFISDGAIVENENNKVLHICMLGSGAVGKSALTLQFIQGQFIADYDPTIEDAYRKHISVDHNTLLLDVLDTAGQEDFIALRTSWMRSKDGFVLAFSIVDRKSFVDCQQFYDQLCEVYEENVPPFVLVGNKADLDPNAQTQSNNSTNNDSNKKSQNNQSNAKYQREISFEEANETARKWNAIRYIETSAKTGYHVQDMFGGLVREIIGVRYREQQKSRTPPKKPWWESCSIL